MKYYKLIFCLVMFVDFLPHSLSGVTPKVKELNRTVTSNKTIDFCEFEHMG